VGDRLARRVVDRLRRVSSLMLIVGVLLGGTFPPLYGDLVPHGHLFLGGPPTPGWEQHDHPNPVLVLLGRSTAPSPPIGPDAASLPSTEQSLHQSTRVLSVYDGLAGSVVSLIALAMILPFLGLFRPPVTWTRMRSADDRQTPAVPRGPSPPPPRGR
jgi:hypothetical protein